MKLAIITFQRHEIKIIQVFTFTLNRGADSPEIPPEGGEVVGGGGGNVKDARLHRRRRPHLPAPETGPVMGQRPTPVAAVAAEIDFAGGAPQELSTKKNKAA